MEKSTMQTNKKTILLMILLVPVFLLSNCVIVQEPPEVAVISDSTARLSSPKSEKQQGDSVAKRFQESASQIHNPTVVESAMELSKKHAILSEEAAVLRQENRDLTARNLQLKDQVVTLEAQLRQTQRELSEANDLLITMRIELNNWKIDILGFRDEIRDAETAQLEALLKILKVLGGEVKTKSAQAEDTSSTAVASVSKPNQSEN
jgi:predicted RNase H-like nuclease (RuvC/YqgF family)